MWSTGPVPAPGLVSNLDLVPWEILATSKAVGWALAPSGLNLGGVAIQPEDGLFSFKNIQNQSSERCRNMYMQIKPREMSDYHSPEGTLGYQQNTFDDSALIVKNQNPHTLG